MSLQTRVDKLFEVIRDSKLFGGITMEDFAKARPFSKQIPTAAGVDSRSTARRRNGP